MGWFRKRAADAPVADNAGDTPAEPGWRELPSMTHAVGPMPMTVQPSFEESLPTRGIPRWVHPLHHGSSAEGPVGVVEGLATVSALGRTTRTDAPPLEFSPAPRPPDRPIVARSSSGSTPPAVDLPTRPAPPAVPPADAGASAGASVPTGATLPLAVVHAEPPGLLLTHAERPPALPPRPLPPVVARAAVGSGTATFPPAADAPTPPPDPAGVAPAGAIPAPAESPVETPAAPVPDAPTVVARRAAAPAVAPSPPPRPSSATPSPPPPSSAPSAGSPPSPGSPPPPVSPPWAGLPPTASPPLPVARRIGLGAPLAARPAPEVVDAAPPPSAQDNALPDRPLVGALPIVAATPPAIDTTPGAPSAADGQGGTSARSEPLRDTAPSDISPVAPPTTLPVVARTATPSAVPPATVPPAADAWPPDPAGPDLATLAERPLVTPSTGPVSEAPIGPHIDVEGPPARRVADDGTGVRLPNVTVHRSLATSTPASGVRGHALTLGGPAHGPAPHRSLAPDAAQELAHVAPRRFGAAPPEPGQAGPRLELVARRAESLGAAPSTPDPGAAAIAAGVAQGAADGSFVFAPPRGEAGGSSDAEVTGFAGSASSVQRAPESAAAPDAQPAPEAAAAPTSAPSAGATPHDDNDKLEQLAKQLYDKIRDRLKAELRLDRERWGRVTDLSR